MPWACAEELKDDSLSKEQDAKISAAKQKNVIQVGPLWVNHSHLTLKVLSRFVA